MNLRPGRSWKILYGGRSKYLICLVQHCPTDGVLTRPHIWGVRPTIRCLRSARNAIFGLANVYIPTM